MALKQIFLLVLDISPAKLRPTNAPPLYISVHELCDRRDQPALTTTFVLSWGFIFHLALDRIQTKRVNFDSVITENHQPYFMQQNIQFLFDRKELRIFC